jgi:hypothetical protein
MIPAVKDFTQKAWIEEQRQLLEKQQQQQQQQEQAVQLVQQQDAGPSAGDGSREPLELLGKVLVTAEELRDKIAVGTVLPGSLAVPRMHARAGAWSPVVAAAMQQQ